MRVAAREDAARALALRDHLDQPAADALESSRQTVARLERDD